MNCLFVAFKNSNTVVLTYITALKQLVISSSLSYSVTESRRYGNGDNFYIHRIQVNTSVNGNMNINGRDVLIKPLTTVSTLQVIGCTCPFEHPSAIGQARALMKDIKLTDDDVILSTGDLTYLDWVPGVQVKPTNSFDNLTNRFCKQMTHPAWRPVFWNSNNDFTPYLIPVLDDHDYWKDNSKTAFNPNKADMLDFYRFIFAADLHTNIAGTMSRVVDLGNLKVFCQDDIFTNQFSRPSTDTLSIYLTPRIPYSFKAKDSAAVIREDVSTFGVDKTRLLTLSGNPHRSYAYKTPEDFTMCVSSGFMNANAGEADYQKNLIFDSQRDIQNKRSWVRVNIASNTFSLVLKSA
jgi:hypothetical protein